VRLARASDECGSFAAGHIEITEDKSVRIMSLFGSTRLTVLSAIALGVFPCAPGWSYPGGPLQDVTDAAPFCAGCHSSTDGHQLRDLPAEQATKMTAAVNHIAAIKAGSGNYAKLTAEQRAQLAADVQRIDDNSGISVEVPRHVHAGGDLAATVRAQGGSGPVIGVMLLDIDLRNQARPIQSEGFQIVGGPQVIGPDGSKQDQWLSRRFDDLARNLNFVVVFGITTDREPNHLPTAKVTYKLKAPAKRGKYTMCAALLYGTEKASPIGRVEVHGRTLPVGGFAGASGRIKFSDVKTIEVD